MGARGGVLNGEGGAEEGFRVLAERLTTENRILAEKVNTVVFEHQNSERYIGTLMDNVAPTSISRIGSRDFCG